MKRYLSLVLLGLVSALAASAHPNLVKVRVRVLLVDHNLNQKPVPCYDVSIKSGAKAAEVKTSLDGTAEAQLPPGRYAVSSPKAAELEGKRFSWSLQVTLSGGEQNIDLTNDNAKVEETAAPASSAKPATNDLTEHFKRLKNTVVTVRSESGHGTGFFVDAKGLVLTNQHVVANSEYLAVQFDRTHKIAAKLIAADPQKDVALLSVNMAALPNASSAPLYRPGAGRTPVQEGERVFTIGSPLSLDKIITTGIVSKVEPHTIMSDVNINPGNSGGPLFNAAGQVIGLTTFGTRGEGGPGVSGIVRIEEALALLDQKRASAKGTPPPVQPQFGGKTQVQDRFPGHETVLWKQGSAPHSSWQGSRNRVDPKPVGKDGRLYLQRDLRVFAGLRESGLWPGEAGDLFLKGPGAYRQGFRREDRSACLGGFRRLPQGPGRRHAISLRRKALNQ